jgi:hypothetical protein
MMTETPQPLWHDSRAALCLIDHSVMTIWYHFKLIYHGVDVADTLKSIIQASVSHFHENLLNRFAVVLRVYEFSAAKFTS